MAEQELASRLRLYLVADFTGRDSNRVLDTVTRSLSAGVTAVQYRHKDALPIEEHQLLARRVRALTAATGALFIVNDNLSLALEVDADGVHLGPHDLCVAEARKTSGDRFVIGGSTGDPLRAVELASAGCSYLGVGALFDARASKPDASAPRGLSVVRSIRAAVNLPLVGIGGITAQNAESVYRSGADGVAMIRSILDSAQPEAEVSSFLAAFARHNT